jgi:hypothetical protein
LRGFGFLHMKRTDPLNHRVDRMLCFFSSRWNCPPPPHPLTRRRVSSPLLGSGGRGTLTCGRGGGGSQFRRGTDTVVL